jgi:hypothetical protein
VVTIFLLIYVDDIVVASSSSHVVEAHVAALRQDFTLEDLGPLHYFLGIEVKENKDGIVMSQRKYALEIIKKAGMEHCKPVKTPLSSTEKYSADKGTLLDAKAATKCRSIVGILQYLTLTRPDLAFSVNKACQFLHAPTSDHMIVVKRILRYVQGIRTLGVKIRKGSSLRINTFSDADWVGCPEEALPYI